MNSAENKQVFNLLKTLRWQRAQAEKYSPKADKLPSHIARLDKNQASDGRDRTFFPLVGKQNQTFENLLNLLLKDPHAKNRSPKEIRKIREVLSDYCRDIIQNKETIRTDQDIETKAQVFRN